MIHDGISEAGEETGLAVGAVFGSTKSLQIHCMQNSGRSAGDACDGRHLEPPAFGAPFRLDPPTKARGLSVEIRSVKCDKVSSQLMEGLSCGPFGQNILLQVSQTSSVPWHFHQWRPCTCVRLVASSGGSH